MESTVLKAESVLQNLTTEVIPKGDREATFGFPAVDLKTLLFKPGEIKLLLNVKLVSFWQDYGSQENPQLPKNEPFLEWNLEAIRKIQLDLFQASCVWFMVYVDGHFLLCRLSATTAIKAESSSKLTFQVPVFATLKYALESPDPMLFSFSGRNEYESVTRALYAALDLVSRPCLPLRWAFTKENPTSYSLKTIHKIIVEETKGYCEQDWAQIEADLRGGAVSSEEELPAISAVEPPKEPPKKRRRKQKHPTQWSSLSRIAGPSATPGEPEERKQWDEEKVEKLPDGTSRVHWKATTYVGKTGQLEFCADLRLWGPQVKEASSNGEDREDFRGAIVWHPTIEK